jgi:decaprenylphospho-beta-D-erythro-pentofuranosid-2-ulose 2-reductase
MRKILIIGAASAIAECCARLWAQRGDRIFLAARNALQLESIVQDLTVRGAKGLGSCVFDANHLAQHASLLVQAEECMGGLDTVLIAHGTLPDQLRAEQDINYALDQINTNGLSVVALLSLVGRRFEQQGHGAIAVISSVAGDRGRQSNYVYGSAKSLVGSFASGLRQRLAKKGVHVLTIKPGFVDSPMTASFRKGPLWAKPHQVARDIVAAVDKKKSVVYTPGFWRAIMFAIKMIPEFLFVKLKL